MISREEKNKVYVDEINKEKTKKVLKIFLKIFILLLIMFTIMFLYSYDQIKKVAYTSDSYYQEYDYMSIFEIYYDGWKIIDKEKAYNMLVPTSFEMPF